MESDRNETKYAIESPSAWDYVRDFVIDVAGTPRRLFPRLPSKKELEARRHESLRDVVRAVGGGENRALVMGRYATEEDLKEKRRAIGIVEVPEPDD
jgi:hypothetical protein